MCVALVAKSQIDVFGLDDFSLFGLFVENRVVQRFAFIVDGNIFVVIQADSDSCIPQGISGTFGLDLVDDFLELEGQVLG